MSSEQQKADFLSEHGPYEMLMLTHCLSVCKSSSERLEWNTHFESFVVHARNLYCFLTNRDSGNFQARDFLSEGFEAKEPQKFHATFQRVRDQVLHMGKKRPSTGPTKAQLPELETVYVWIAEKLREFVEALPKEYQSKWDWEKTRPHSPSYGPAPISDITQTGTISIIKTEIFSASSLPQAAELRPPKPKASD